MWLYVTLPYICTYMHGIASFWLSWCTTELTLVAYHCANRYTLLMNWVGIYLSRNGTIDWNITNLFCQLTMCSMGWYYEMQGLQLIYLWAEEAPAVQTMRMQGWNSQRVHLYSLSFTGGMGKASHWHRMFIFVRCGSYESAYTQKIKNCHYDVVICHLRCMHADERTDHGDCISTCVKNMCRGIQMTPDISSWQPRIHAVAVT